MNAQEELELADKIKSTQENVFCFKFFENWLNKIKDEDLKNLVSEYLKNTPSFQVVRPTSSTKKYHPEYQNLTYGNGLHTKALLKTLEIYETANPNLDWDCLYIAGICHDLRKYDREDSEHTNRNHNETGAKAFRKFADKYVKGLKSDDIHELFSLMVKLSEKIEKIERLIYYHGGYFTPNMELGIKLTEEQMTLHYADMVAASTAFKDLNDFEPKDTIMMR